MDDCAFCKTPIPDNEVDRLVMLQARVTKKDSEAVYNLGLSLYHGNLGLQKDARRAVELWTEAAELGSIQALFNIGFAYYFGDGVQQDATKSTEFYKRAAMRGHVDSRHNLGCSEEDRGDYDSAVRHLLISAKMGLKDSLESIKKTFMRGLATKEQYAEALKGYQHALEEMKSHNSDVAMAFLDKSKAGSGFA